MRKDMVLDRGNVVMEHEEMISEDSSSNERFEDSEDEADDHYFHQYVDDDVLDDLILGRNFNVVESEQMPNTSNSEIMPSSGVGEEDLLVMPSDYESDELHSDEGSEENEYEIPNRYPQYNPLEMCKDFQFKLGMEFISIAQFKEAVREYSLLHGYDIQFKKNDKVRCRVVCKGECPWLMFVSKVGGLLTYRLKTFNPKHTCGVTFNSKMASSKWVAQKIVARMRTSKNMKLIDVINCIREYYMADVSVNKAYWARRLAKAMLDGDFKDQYRLLRDYCNEVRTSNPGTTFQLLTNRPIIDRPPMFKRLYLCLDAMKKGFLRACRPIMGLDGCFLKGPYGGILLVAVARDPNDQYFPLAVAVVEGENKDSWSWFLDHLFDDIGRISERRWVFISDQQKGLVPTFEEKLQGVEHRFCVRHLYSNIKSRCGGGTIVRNLVLRAAKATYIQEWERVMLELKRASQPAHDHLMNIPPSCWTKSHFSEYPRCDMILNNISESFNGRLVEARELPIISMFEWIRTYLMTRFAENRIRAQKYKGRGTVCPKPRRRLDKEVEESRNWVAKWAGGNKFEVSLSHHIHKFKVDLDESNCSCRWWGLTGLPCRHAISCILTKREDPQHYVHPYLTLTAFEECYSPVIKPANGQNLWVSTGMEAIDPPTHHKRPGRPKKLRRRGTDEPPPPNKSRRSNTSLRCKACGNYGHNSRTCQRRQSQGGPSSMQESIPMTCPRPSQP